MAGHRLGRHIAHDPRSRGYRVQTVAESPTTKVWSRRTVWDQGKLGSCTGNALVGVAATEPFHLAHHRYTEAVAVAVYERATQLDSVHGVYPPDDTGSTGLAAAKAIVERGLARAYRWGFGIEDLTRTVAQNGPAAVGTNWHTGMDTPNADGLVKVTGAVRGGHEYEVIGWHADTTLGAPQANVFECQNSWGQAWGVTGTHGPGGRFFITHADMAKLLDENGDCVTLEV